MMFILQFFFFIFIAVLIVGLFIVVRIFLTLRRTAGKFRDFAGGGFRREPKNDGGPRYDKKRGVTIIDTRDDAQRNRKIFADGVGEYVKYKEVR